MQNLDELKAAADKAAARHEAWKAALAASEIECSRAQTEMHELLGTPCPPGEMAAFGDRLAKLLGRINALQLFATNYRDAGIRHEVSTRHSHTAYAYQAAQKDWNAAQQKLIDLQRAAIEAAAQFGTQAQGSAPKPRKAGRVVEKAA